jgi:hypothetical protein
MKYIFLFALLITTVTTQAVTTMDGDGNTNTTAFDGNVDISQSTSFGLGGGNTDSTTLGGGNTDSTVLGGGGTAHPVQLAELAKPSQSISGFVIWFIQLLNYVVMALLTAALLFFLYGVFVLMFVGGMSEESRSKGRQFMMWGIVSLFVMVSVWGLVNVLKTSVFGTTDLIFPTFK